MSANSTNSAVRTSIMSAEASGATPTKLLNRRTLQVQYVVMIRLALTHPCYGSINGICLVSGSNWSESLTPSEPGKHGEMLKRKQVV